MPTLAVLIPTYNRASIVQRCVEALRQNLRGASLVFYVGCAGNDNTPHVFGGTSDVICLDHRGAGLGENLNRLIKHTEGVAQYLMQLDDDHILTAPMDVTKVIAEVERGPIEWVRLMHIGSHFYTGRLIHQFWRVDWNSPELYITSNRPHIKHRRFHDVMGLYPEKLKLGQTEEQFCHHCKGVGIERGEQGPFVGVPLDYPTESGWQHVGDSWQGKGF